MCAHFKVVEPYTACVTLANALRSTTIGCDEQFANKVDDIAKQYKTSSNRTLLPENTCDEGLMFRCPCQRCSLDSYLENGCPKSNTASFPYLDLKHLSEEEKEDILQQLEHDYVKMTKAFANLLTDTRESLIRRGVKVKEIADTALDLGAFKSEDNPKPLLHEHRSELNSMTGIFNVLRQHSSFFNFEILGYIIERLGTDEDRHNLENYRQELDKFCKHKVFQVSPSIGQTLDAKHKRTTFVVLITKDIVSTLADVRVAKRRIATLLGLKSSTLHLHTVDDGSIILLFSVPNFVANELFPLSEETQSSLKAEGFLILSLIHI